MKIAHEIFLMLGVPIISHTPRYRGFRAFNEHNVAWIQADALRLAESIADNYLQSMGSRDAMNVANLICEEIRSEIKRLKGKP